MNPLTHQLLNAVFEPLLFGYPSLEMTTFYSQQSVIEAASSL
jgi:hypothetical protein